MLFVSDNHTFGYKKVCAKSQFSFVISQIFVLLSCIDELKMTCECPFVTERLYRKYFIVLFVDFLPLFLNKNVSFSLTSF